ncbi:MAG: hypothetical protein HY696_03305 [Deltaproteobacteria bacterium]|nr:hypothetical protein [Deltaproteobacteria bacterium]
MSQRPFLLELQRILPELKRLHAEAETTIYLDANFGHYRVRIGPVGPTEPNGDTTATPQRRPIEIDATLDHLYVEGVEVSPLPTRHAIDQHLKTTVILHGVQIHIHDPDGAGYTISLTPPHAPELRVTHTINLAGDDGTRRLNNLQQTGDLARKAYGIVQRDLLQTLKRETAQRRNSSVS